MRECRRYLFHEIAELDHLDETDVFVRAESYDQLAKENAELKAKAEKLVECLELNRRQWLSVAGKGTQQAAETIPCIDAALRDYKKGSEG